ERRDATSSLGGTVDDRKGKGIVQGSPLVEPSEELVLPGERTVRQVPPALVRPRGRGKQVRAVPPRVEGVEADQDAIVRLSLRALGAVPVQNLHRGEPYSRCSGSHGARDPGARPPLATGGA